MTRGIDLYNNISIDKTYFDLLFIWSGGGGRGGKDSKIIELDLGQQCCYKCHKMYYKLRREQMGL